MTVLFIIPTGERADMVKLLLKNGANPTGINWPRNTLLHTAAESTENEVLGVLLEIGLEPNAHLHVQ